MTYYKYKKPKRKDTKCPNYEYPYPDDGGWYNPNMNAVCFKCREAKRYNRRFTEKMPKCPVCNKQMIGIFCKTEVPRKTNDRGWKLLERKYDFLIKIERK